MATEKTPSPVRFSGAAADSLLSAETAKQSETERARPDETGATPSSASGHTSGDNLGQTRRKDNAEGTGEEGEPDIPTKRQQRDKEEQMREGTLAKERLVRSVLSTRIALPRMDDSCHGVLRAVLRGITEDLDTAARREGLTGVAVALTADERKRTALHLAVGSKNIRMVYALMRWRQVFNRTLQDELDELDYRRDVFIQDVMVTSRISVESTVELFRRIERFRAWLYDERRRILRVMELRCEECWRKVVTARDDEGRTPIHWAASVGGTDDSLLRALLTTGRADLSARDANHRSDMKYLSELEAKLRCGASDAEHASGKGREADVSLSASNGISMTIFSRDGEFHMRTGRLRRRRAGPTKKQRGQREKELRVRDARGSCAGLSQTSNREKVWFCEALRNATKKLAGSLGRDAEALLLNVFEDFNRNGDGKLFLRQFCGALHDVNLRLSDRTLLEVGRYFRAMTSRHSGGRREHHTGYESRNQSIRYGDEDSSDSMDGRDIEVSYFPLVEVVFGRRGIRPTRHKTLTQGNGDSSYHPSIPEEGNDTEDDAKSSDGSEGEEDDSGTDESYTNVRRILAVRAEALDVPDSLGRRPLFLAAAAGAISAAKTLVRHGATSSIAVEGTDLTAHGIASSSLMKIILTSEARWSLDKMLALKKRHRHIRRAAAQELVVSPASDNPLVAAREIQRDEAKTSKDRISTSGEKADADNVSSDNIARRRMKFWISTVADGELAAKGAYDTLVADHKTSLHLAASSGLPGMVHTLLERGLGGVLEKSGRGRLERPAWTSSPKSSGALRGGGIDTTCAWNNPSTSRRVHYSPQIIISRPDASGWSPLHACCGEARSAAHFHCAVNLLGAEMDPNSKTNTGKTPLHVVACASDDDTDHRVGSDLIPLLVSHGGDLEARDEDGLRPIHYAAKAGKHATLLSLLVAGAHPGTVTPRRWNALHYAVACGHCDAVRLLAWWDSDSGALLRQKNSAGVTPRDLGRQAPDHQNLLRVVLNRNEEVRTAARTIWEAAALGDAEQVSRACLETARFPKGEVSRPWNHPGVNAKSPGLGFTPLHACMAGLAVKMKRLDVSVPCTPPTPQGKKGCGGLAALPGPSLYEWLAHQEGRAAQSAIVSGKSHKESSTPFIDGMSPFLAGAIGKEKSGGKDHLAVCRVLLSAGADVMALDARDRSPLALASATGSLEVVEVLLGAGSDSRAIDADGNTPAHFAFAYANAAVASLLFREGADLKAPNGEGRTPQDVAGLCTRVAPLGRRSGTHDASW